MSFPSSIKVYITYCHRELLPFVNKMTSLCLVSKSSNFDQNFIKLDHKVKYQNVYIEFHFCLCANIALWVIVLCLCDVWYLIQVISNVILPKLDTMLNKNNTKKSCSSTCSKGYCPMFIHAKNKQFCLCCGKMPFIVLTQTFVSPGHILVVSCHYNTAG